MIKKIDNRDIMVNGNESATKQYIYVKLNLHSSVIEIQLKKHKIFFKISNDVSILKWEIVFIFFTRRNVHLHMQAYLGI